MLYSFAIIIICGFALAGIAKKLKLPSLVGMILAGIILGPNILNIMDSSVLTISADLRKMALIVILIRAGLALDITNLKKVGRPAILMCFIPATFEFTFVTMFGPIFFDITYLEAAMMGAVLAAVSPAVVIPRMLRLVEQGYGKTKGIPELIMAGASVDDVYVIVLFTSLLGMYQGIGFDVISLFKVPVSIVVGLLFGMVGGFFSLWIFKKIRMQDTVKLCFLIGIAFFLVSFEDIMKSHLPMSGLLAVMTLGATILKKNEALAKCFSVTFTKIWVVAELLLFVLVGAAVEIGYIGNVGVSAILLIIGAFIFRMIGVLVCLLKTDLNKKEKLFCVISYLPKATVQAAIGGIPLSVGVRAGNTILTVAVLAITITAPLGAIGMDRMYKKLLSM